MDQVNILVVDSIPKNLEFLAQILGTQNYNVYTHSTLEAAWQVVESGLIELVLLNFEILDLEANEFWQDLQFHSKTHGIAVLFFHSDRLKGLEKYSAIQPNVINLQTDYISDFLSSDEVIIRIKNQLIIKRKQLKSNQDNSKIMLRTQQKTAELENNNKQLQAEIKQHQKTQNKLLQLALHDSVTGLPNRNSFLGKIKQLLPHYQEQAESQFAVLLIGSKQIEKANLSSSYADIKQLITVIGDRLKACLPNSAFLSRFESDNFAIILEHVTEGKEEVKKWIEIIQAEFRRSLHSEAKTSSSLDLEIVDIPCEIGVVFNHRDYAAAYEVLLNAEKSLFQAQKISSLGYHFFLNKSDSARNQDNLTQNNLNLDIFNLQADVDQDNKVFKNFKNHFYESVVREKIVLYYQPIFSFNKFAKKDLTNNQIVGLEILDNLHDHYRKIILLTNLFDEFEESDFNNCLTNFTLEYACFLTKELQTQSHSQKNFFVTIKFTQKNLFQNLLAAKISNILKETDLEPRFLHIDIALDDQQIFDQQILSIVKELSKLGVLINLDCSNLGYENIIKISDSLFFNSLKIPGIVTPPITRPEDLVASKSSSTLLSGKTEVLKIIKLAHQKGMTVMARGIETVEQLKYLSSIDCDYGQGSWFSKPLDKKALESFLIWGT